MVNFSFSSFSSLAGGTKPHAVLHHADNGAAASTGFGAPKTTRKLWKITGRELGLGLKTSIALGNQVRRAMPGSSEPTPRIL